MFKFLAKLFGIGTKSTTVVDINLDSLINLSTMGKNRTHIMEQTSTAQAQGELDAIVAKIAADARKKPAKAKK